MIIKFYVNGTPVDIYRCDGHIEYDAGGDPQFIGLTDHDVREIESKKHAAYRNYGYPAVLVYEDK